MLVTMGSGATTTASDKAGGRAEGKAADFATDSVEAQGGLRLAREVLLSLFHCIFKII